ncbi:hypothetical protein TcBrA4_0067020 [Trypanosoma cruzi]|nr:hypothetical protein TcBrA4_0067020 [Trypanosoma cruzi]
MCWQLCNCRVEGEELREVRERRGQESRWVSRRQSALPALPSTAHAWHPLSHCSIVIDATSTQRGSGCHHRHECDLKWTRLLLRFEGHSRVAQWRAHNLLAEPAHDTGHWPRSVCVLKDAAVESLLPPRGGTPDFPFVLTQADGCAMTPHRGIRFTMAGQHLQGHALGM